MKILILGSYFSDNLGDGVICECVKYQLHQRFSSAEIAVWDLWKRDQFQTRGLKSVSELAARERRNWVRAKLSQSGLIDKQYKHEQNMIEIERKYLEEICAQNCDMVVFAGGQMFMDAYAMKICYIVDRFSKRNIPIIFNACGAGPNYSKQIQKCLSQALGNPWVTAVSCRDDVELVNRYYAKGCMRVVPTYDPALWCGTCYGVQQDEESNIMGLGIMAPARSSIGVVRRFWERLICELERRGIAWKVFVNGSGSDDTFARHVIASIPGLGRSFEECSVPIPKRPEELVRVISQFKSIISFRLHSHIIATSLGVPSVAAVWDNKVRIFFEKIGCPERCCTLREKPSKVLDKLAAAEREGYNQTLLDEQRHYSGEWLINAIEKTGLI